MIRQVGFILIFQWIAFCAWAQEAIVLTDKKQGIYNSPNIYFYEDKNNKLDITNISTPHLISFEKLNQKIPNYGIIQHTIWAKFYLENQTGEKLFLLIKNASIDSISLYIPNNKGFIVKHTGTYLSSSQREWNTNFFILEIPDLPKEQSYYLRFKSDKSLMIPLFIGTKDKVWRELLQSYLVDTSYFGVLIAMILYNTFVFISLRRRTYFYYVLHGISLLILVADYQGYWSMVATWLYIFLVKHPIISIIPAALAIILFTNSFLQIKHFHPKLHIFFKILFGIFIGIACIDLLALIDKGILIEIANFIGLLLLFSLLYAGVVSYLQKYIPALFFLIAWGMYCLLAIWVVLVHFDILKSDILIVYNLQIGSTIEMLFFSFALTYRINLLEKEKMDSQQQLVITLQDKERSVSEQNILLESKVQERTADLQSKQEEILRQNEELTAQQEEMLKQQGLIEQKNKELTLINRRMKANEEVLRKAYHKLSLAQETIQSQNKELKNYNENLEQEILQRTQEISQTNLELIKQNNQLEQFAFITAHNLRAPVARMLGLASILDTKNPQNAENFFVIEKMVFVANELETVIRDLNIILEIKKGLNQLIEEVKFSEKMNKVCASLATQIQESQAKIIIDFSQIDLIQSVSPYIESILYNLVSNAIKYRKPKESPIIKVKTELLEGDILLTVSDNGLGMDLEAHKGKVFGLYRRFHDHVEGKGLGLYLIKTQVETLGGKISIESTLGEGTTFYILLKKI
jgi:signal transduction histidine kinase